MDREYHLPQFRKLQVGLSIVSKESVLIRCIFLDKQAEGWVREEGFVTWQLQKAFLLTTQKLLEVRVIKDQRVGSPGSLKARPILVASSLHEIVNYA
jgi:hypothetical protein